MYMYICIYILHIIIHIGQSQFDGKILIVTVCAKKLELGFDGRRYLTLQIIPQTLPKKVLGSTNKIWAPGKTLPDGIAER